VVEVRLDPAARADLAEIDAYGAAEFGDTVADDYSRGFTKAFDLLRRHPSAGPAQPDFGEEIRCLIHNRHRIFYKIKPDFVLILRILHHARTVRRGMFE
jgi:toxin ParE1/3/4